MDEKYRKEIISLAENQTTSSMSSRKIAYIMNKKFEEENLDITISKDTVNRYLKEELGKPRKIRKVFHLTKKKKEERVKFCKRMLEREIDGGKIFFTQIQIGAYIKDSIRLSKENQIKLKEGKKIGF